MTEDLKLIRQQLDSQLTKASSSRAMGDSIRIQQVADPLDMTQEALARDMAVQILDRESALARGLRSAIARIDDGSYGICHECEEKIAPKRLKAIPWAELCFRVKRGRMDLKLCDKTVLFSKILPKPHNISFGTKCRSWSLGTSW